MNHPRHRGLGRVNRRARAAAVRSGIPAGGLAAVAEGWVGHLSATWLAVGREAFGSRYGRLKDDMLWG